MNSFKKPQLEVFPYQFSPHNPLKISIWGEFKWDTYENKDNSMHMVRLQIKRSNESHTVVLLKICENTKLHNWGQFFFKKYSLCNEMKILGPKQVWRFQDFLVMFVLMKHKNCADNQNDSILLLQSSLQWSTGIVLLIFPFYHFIAVL